MGLLNKEKKDYQKWSKSSTTKGVTKTISVEEIENGFLVCTDEYGNIDGDYTSEYKKYYSATNPLSGMKPVKGEDISSVINDFLKDI